MKNMFKFSVVALLAMSAVGFTACSEKDDFAPGIWDASANYADVYFPKSSYNSELEPTAPTEFQIPIMRRNVSGSVTVPITIEENEGNIFNVTNPTFNEGDSVAYVGLSFPSAEVGVPYSVKLSIDGTDYVSSYSKDNMVSYSVQRIKWNTVGFYYDNQGNKVEGMCLYTDDFVTTFFGVSNVSYPVKVQERDDKKGYFRVFNAYGAAYPYNEEGDYDPDNDYFIFIDATSPKNVYIPMACEQGTNWSYGNFICHSKAGYYLAKGDNASAAANYGTYANGAITFPVDALLFAMAEYNSGGLYGSNGNGAFKLVINPDLEVPAAYEADIENDFEWEEVYEGSFDSQILGSSSNVTLMKGTCVNTTDDCDKTFAATYGTLYALLDPYGPNSPIYFGVTEDGKITNPAGKQPTGMKALSEDVYVIVNSKGSEFTEKIITLSMTFINNESSIDYGTTTETLSNITWNLVGTGTYTYNVMYGEDVPDPGYELYQREDKPEIYKIPNWFEGADFTFKWDSETNKVVVTDQFSGYVHPSYGEVWVDEVSDYAGEEVEPSYYDPESKTFYFGLIYYVSAGSFGHGYETFTFDEQEETPEPVAASSKKFANSSSFFKGNNIKALTRANRFVGKKLNIKALNTPSGLAY